jgi:hypothetical protein
MRIAIWRGTLLCTLVVLLQASEGRQSVRSASGFASEIERLSEPEGSFDTDNLISNEAGYLGVIPALVAGGVSGGTYIGVGPDQNFSYIARIRPTLAYIIDIRRDNLLLHLLFKALFARSATRVEYVSLLTGRAPPTDLNRWRHSTIGQITDHVDAQTPALTGIDGLRHQVRAAVTGFGVPLSPTDLDTIDRFHRTFIDAGLDLRFQTFGRLPQPGYPSFRALLHATDANGQPWNYLAREDDFQFVKSLQARDGVIPIVGNVAGTHSMHALADEISAHGGRVSAFYLSNVETYLNRGADMARLIENMNRLPHDARSVTIRSIFGRDGASTSVVEPFLSRGPGYRR